MLIKDLLFEDVQESKEVNILAKFVADNIMKCKKVINQGTVKMPININNISKVLNIPIPQIKSAALQPILNGRVQFSITWSMHGEGGFHYNNDPGEDEITWITINEFLADEYPEKLEALLTHEIQHAADYFKSAGKAFNQKASDAHISNKKTYLSNPLEINARFAEVLLAISKLTNTDNIVNNINSEFKNNKIFRDLYDQGTKGQQKYNQLLKRAYKFYDELLKIKTANSPRSTKIKELINKTINKTINAK